MFKSTKTMIISLAVVGAVALGGATYATNALAASGANAAPAVTAQTAADPQLRASILDMLKDRMGLTGANAETFADQMIAYMQSVNPNFDLQAMVNWCDQYAGDNSSGWGMMGGNSSAYGWGMMGAYGATSSTTPPTGQPSASGGNTPVRPGQQNRGPSYYPGGMMNGGTAGGGMMGGWSTN